MYMNHEKTTQGIDELKNNQLQQSIILSINNTTAQKLSQLPFVVYLAPLSNL
jgi:hypothetical protein